MEFICSQILFYLLYLLQKLSNLYVLSYNKQMKYDYQNSVSLKP